MKFHLEFPIASFAEKINYAHSLFFVGSCFAENIGEIMQHYKFRTTINPHGVLYNPASIAIALRRYIENKEMQEGELFFANDCWHSPEHHSRFSNTNKQSCLGGINKSISEAHHTLKNADWLFVTLGSAYVYKQKEKNTIVGNCHKLPQKEFTKQLLSAEEITNDYTALLQELKQFNNKLKIIFTISPVRYIRDGVVENNISKAQLIQAVHELVKQNNNTFYFPAYELIIDDLRDYRFYKTDLVHPNEQAIEYVFDKLKTATFDEETNLLFEKVRDIVVALSHRPFNKNSESHQKFKATYLERCKQLQKQYSFLDFSDVLSSFVSKQKNSP